MIINAVDGVFFCRGTLPKLIFLVMFCLLYLIILPF